MAFINKKIYPALTYRDFRYFWCGQWISLIGTWMQYTAQQWLVYSLTKSALLLGILGIAQFGPVMLFSLMAGVIIDRYPKRKVLLITQSVLLIQAILFAILVWTDYLNYWFILILATILGFANTFDQPARQSFIGELVGKQDLRNAISLNSTIVNIARLVGPALAAIMLNQYGAGLLFFMNGVSFIPVILGIYLIKGKTEAAVKYHEKISVELLEGLRYIKNSPIILSTISAMLIIGTFVMNLNVIAPLYVGEVINGGVNGYGAILSANGVGSLIGALLVATLGKGNIGLKSIFGSGLIVALLLALLSFIKDFHIALLLFAILGFFNIMFITNSNSIIQINTEEKLRGRVMSVYNFAFLGTTPIGNLLAGVAMEKFDTEIGILLCGIIALVLLIFVMLILGRNKPIKNT